MKALTAIAVAITAGPRVEIYTILACQVYKPEYVGTSVHQSSITHRMHFVPPSRRTSPPLSTLSALNINLRHEEPIYFVTRDSETESEAEGTTGSSNRCARDPEVQAAVAELSASE